MILDEQSTRKSQSHEKRDSWSSYESQDGFAQGRRGEIVKVGPGLGRSMPTLRIDGPYGAPAEDVFKSEVAVLVAAGIGVTVSSSPKSQVPSPESQVSPSRHTSRKIKSGGRR